MKLHNCKSYITSLPEGSPPANFRPRITQIIYYSILLLVVAYIINIFASRYFYFKETGFVEIERTIISASHGGKLLKLNFSEGQAIKYKQHIATIAASKQCAGSPNLNGKKLEYNLALNKSKLSLLQRTINNLKSNLKTFNLQRALETGQARDSSANKLRLELAKKQNEAALLDSQIVLQQNYLNSNNISDSIYQSAGCFNETIYAPFSGHIHSIQNKVNEYAARGAPLLTLIANNANVRIEAYLNSDQLASLKIGNIVDITFADNIQSEAKIKNIYSSAYNVPNREWNYYKPADTQVRIHLEPTSQADTELWKQYDRMEVTVKGRK